MQSNSRPVKVGPSERRAPPRRPQTSARDPGSPARGAAPTSHPKITARARWEGPGARPSPLAPAAALARSSRSWVVANSPNPDLHFGTHLPQLTGRGEGARRAVGRRGRLPDLIGTSGVHLPFQRGPLNTRTPLSIGRG